MQNQVFRPDDEKGIGRLNACPTMVCKLLVCRGGAGGFACVLVASQTFFIILLD
jgi:hypothetical protein